MKTLFAMYFSSNKTDSNKFIGALGLGSKSPFCYKGNGGSYTIISRHKGVTRAYSANLTNGLPGLTPFAPVETPGARNGIEIKFAVKTSDCYEWENKARIALEMFDPSPVTNLSPPLSPPPMRSEQFYVLKAKSWGLRKTAYTPQGSGARAIMGNVQYQIGYIDASKITTEAVRKVSELPLDIYFPIGAIDFNISRETLEMTERTIDSVLEAYGRIYEEIVDSVREKIEACATPWEARLMLWQLIYEGDKDKTSNVGWVVTAALNDGKLYGKYRNFELTDKVSRVVEMDYEKTTVTTFRRNDKATGAAGSPRCSR